MSTKERPILFSTPMVQALLSGTKTQTRRIVKPEPHAGMRWDPIVVNGYGGWTDGHGRPRPCPYGVPGDRLWVRETTLDVEAHGYKGPVYFASREGQAMWSDGLGPSDDYTDVAAQDLKLRPSIFMPRRYARIILEVTDVRVERLQSINEEDARAEGAPAEFEVDAADFLQGRSIPKSTHYLGFKHLWRDINGAESWTANPWVWAVSFRQVTP